MKKYLTLLVLVFTFQLSYSQCDMKEIEKKAEAKMNNLISIKTFKLDLNKGSQNNEFSYVLAKEVEYMFALNTEKGDDRKVIINLYNSNKKLIASNYDEKNNHYSNTLLYKCPSTKMYYITITTQDDTKCVACVVGFRSEVKKKLNPW